MPFVQVTSNGVAKVMSPADDHPAGTKPLMTFTMTYAVPRGRVAGTTAVAE
jgi:hypothetical protein